MIQVGVPTRSLTTYLSAVVLLLSVIVLGLSADMVTTTNKYYDTYFTFNAFSIAVAVLTFSLGPLYVPPSLLLVPELSAPLS